MNNEMLNASGCMDLTAYEAIKNVSKKEKLPFMPLIYICSPYSGDISQNVEKATSYAKFAYESGCIPVTPHLLFNFLSDDDPSQRRVALHMDIVLMGKCEEVWVFGSKISSGMEAEIDKAKQRRQKVRYFTEDFREVDA